MDNTLKIFRGVVEDNDDPLKICRVKVRILGIHTENNENSTEEFEFIKTSDLPWLEVAGNVQMGLIGGIGISSVLKKGTWVWVILEQGDPNKGIVIGSIIGINSESSVDKAVLGKGFYDPDEKYPFVKRSQETDVNRLARGENLSEIYYDNNSPILNKNTTMHQQINDTIDIVNITDALSGANVSQIEPSSTSNLSIYPNNNVLETASGHIIEFDDSNGNERIRLIHRTGSYFEIKPNGTFVQKSVNQDSESHFISMSSVNEHIKKSVKKYIEENVDEIIKGYVKRSIEGTLDEHITGALTINAGADVTIKATGTVNVECSEIIGTASGNITLEAGGNANVTAGGTVAIEASGVTTNCDITVTGGDVIADGVSLKNHFSLGNLGFNTGVPIPTGNPGVPAPANPPSMDGGDIIDGNGTKSTLHTHPYTWTEMAGSGNTGTAS
jgi:hypothetical protein